MFIISHSAATAAVQGCRGELFSHHSTTITISTITTHPVSVPSLPLLSPPLLVLEEMVLVGGATRVHVHPVRPAARPAHAPHLPPLARDEVEELLLLHQVGHGHELAVVGVTVEYGPVADTAVSGPENLRFVL